MSGPPVGTFRAGSVDVLEQLHDPLHVADLAGRLGNGVGFLVGDQTQQVNRAVIGHHLDPGSVYRRPDQYLGRRLWWAMAMTRIATDWIR